MSENPVPLEKQLLHLQLGGGVTERERPETADPSKTLTQMENLLQDQTGAYVKRYGTPLLGGVATDSAGNNIHATKLIRTRSGVAMIGSAAEFFQYTESSQRFTQVDKMPDFIVTKADQVCSTGVFVTPTLSQAASSTKYHTLVHSIGAGASNDSGYRLVFYGRDAEAITDIISLGDDFGSNALNAFYTVFVDDRYLHVYGSSGTGISALVYDTSVSPIAKVAAPVALSATDALVDFDRTTGRSFVLSLYTGVTTIYAVNNAGAIVDSSVTTGMLPAKALSVEGTKVWYVTVSDIESRLTTNLATIVDAQAAHILGTAIGRIVVSGGVIWNAKDGTVSLGSSTIAKIDINNSTTGTIYPLNGWILESYPFIYGGKIYVHASKDSGLSVTPHAIVCISDRAYNIEHSTEKYYSFPLSASLEPMIGVHNGSTNLKYFQVGDEYHPAVITQTTARGYAQCFMTIRQYDHSKIGSVLFGGQNYMSGGVPCVYGSNKIQESGYVDVPLLNAVQSSTSGTSGSYRHIAVFRYIDETGSVSWSRCSTIRATVTTNKGVDLTVCPATVTIRDYVNNSADPLPVLHSVEIYRTVSGGTQFYLCGSSQIGTPLSGLGTQLVVLASTGFYTLTDTLSDATLATQPLLFRQPGTANSSVDRYPPPPGMVICQHKDRLFTTDHYGRVYYSSFFVDGETAWFNPVFSFFTHGGTGLCTGMVSMDGRLFIFKRDSIFVVDGDGPPEGGVAGNEFSPPQRLATEYGCVDHRSIVVTTEGIVYRSPRGIEILTRSLQVKWLGERVQDTVDAHEKITGALLDAFGRVRIGLAVTDSGTATQAGIDGCELVYDFPSDCWTISRQSDHAGDYGRCFQDMVMADIIGAGETVCYADGSRGVRYTDPSSGLDGGVSYIPWTVETGWIKTGQQARQRVYGVLLLAKKLTNHAVRISLAYDYVDSYTQVTTWEPSVLNTLAIEELLVKPNKPLAIAIRIKIEERLPVESVSVGNGRGADLLGITLEMANLQKAPFANRGTAGALSTPPQVSGIVPATGTTAGGTAVTIYGVGFTSGTTFSLNGNALTSVALISSTEMAAFTPANAAAAYDLVAVNGGGTDTLAGAFTYVAPVGVFDPTTLGATIYVRPNYAGLPWMQTATAGPSGHHRDLITYDTDPTVGAAALNGYDVAVFDGAGNNMRSHVTDGLAVTSSNGGVIFLFNPDATSTSPTGLIFNDPTVVSSLGGTFGVSYTTAGVSGWGSDGAYKEAVATCSSGSWHLVMFRWDGVNMGITVDSASEVTVAFGPMLNLADSLLVFGNVLGSYPGVWAGKMAELMIMDSTPSPTDYANFKSYVNTTYGLAL